MNVYIGTFLIALTTLALEITLSRLLSVITWYHLAFFAISTAMLGMTAGATTVYLKPHWFTPEKLNTSIAKACLGYALITPFSLILLCLLPLEIRKTIMSLFAFLMATFACSLPFYFSGIALSAILTKSPLPIGKLYASDLIGASLGCLLVLGGLELMDAPSLILLCSAIGILAVLSFTWYHSSMKLRSISGILLILLTLSAYFNTATLYGIRPFFIKGRMEDVNALFMEKWNSFSRVVVGHRSEEPPQYWGASSLAPQTKLPRYNMNIDGEAGTVVRRFSSLADLEHLRFDVTNIAYYLRPPGNACIIGVGGGRDVQSAILFGYQKVTGIDINPIFINLLNHPFKDFAGIAKQPGVTLLVDEARSYLSRTKDQYSLIQMSLIDTWAATGAGAFSLSENALYTTEAWQVFFNRLADEGIFTVSRWYNPGNLNEAGRLLSLAVASLLQMGITNPSSHLAMVTAAGVSTLLLSKQPFQEAELATLKKLTTELHYDLVIVPNQAPANDVLRQIITARSLDQLTTAVATGPLNYEPPTDENPYFFNMLRLNHLNAISIFQQSNYGVLHGNLVATVTLIILILSLLLLAAITVILPLFVKLFVDRSRLQFSRNFWSAALYFSLIGAGFMFVEIALIQRLSVFLSHPVYALGILLFTIIASTGVGSFLSERLPLTRTPWLFIYPLATALTILIIHSALLTLLANLITVAMWIKILVSILVIFPLGILMGFFFPTGMKLAQATNTAETPWYWALNGIFGVLCSALAVFISIYFGVSQNFYLGSCCYAALVIVLYQMHRKNSLL